MTTSIWPTSTNLGVGTNQPYSPAGSMLPSGTWPMGSSGFYWPELGATEAAGAVVGGLGKAIDVVGKATGNILPELGISERMQTTGAALNPQSDAQVIDAYRKMGWNDPAAIMADYQATGGSKLATASGGGSTATPAQTYNIRGTNVNAPSGMEALKQAGLGGSDYSSFQQQYPNVEDFLRSIDTEYSSAEQSLGTQENALKEAVKLYESTIAKDYESNLAKAQASKASTTGKLEAGKVEAEQKKQDALTAATKLYNELQQGYRQRFGGASSAGEAAQSILGSEQQRQSGLIGRNYMNALSTIEAQKADLENNYNSAIADLDSQKQKSIQDVQLNFQNNLQQINSNRALSVAAREQAKRQILIDNRNQIAQIEANNVAYQRQLEAMKVQQQLALDASVKQMQTQAGLNLAAGQTAVGKIPTTVTSNLGQQNQTVSQGVMPTTPSINTAVGSIRYDSAGLPISSTKNWWEQ